MSQRTRLIPRKPAPPVTRKRIVARCSRSSADRASAPRVESGMKLARLAAALALATAPLTSATAGGSDPIVQTSAAYEQIVSSVSNMVGDSEAAQMVAKKGLDLVNVMWEDT